ncbi:hypothetical protein MSG28_006202 [Choristoneura fumiferana]|uniref:Uncharacterized protein n=1 Tax=Choristoneura fumiferana TaxID=7141 RepID=A0ACC0JE22_CHOFU|nr:hypothetical protein MSG28_006202 [Choristoneura fumiferana]
MVGKSNKLYVHKRGGRVEEVHIDKITSRIKKLCYGLNMDFVDPVIGGIYSGVTTVELDNLAAETAATMTTDHPDYAVLAARLAISNLTKETKKHFSDVITDLYNIVNKHTKKRSPMISDFHYDIVMKNKERLDSAIVAERPQHMLMRVSIGIHGEDIDAAINTYNLLSEKYFTHASPTLFSAATPRPQLSSCFLIAMRMTALKAFMILSSSVPLSQNLQVALAFMYIALEPREPILLEQMKNTGKEEVRARELFYALWIPDLFMKRVENNENWSLMCPHDSPGLADCWGDEFQALYEKYEQENNL